MMLMKNERCLIKKSLKMMKKMVKMSCIFIGLTFLMGFYDERNIHIDLEDVTVELGSTLNIDKFEYINNLLSNTKFFLEDSVSKNEYGETTKIGTYNYYIVYRDEERMYSRLTNKRATITVFDTIKPEIKLKETSLKFEFGSKIKASDIATCLDLSTCSVDFKEDVNTRKSGKTEVVIVATDEGGNVQEKTVEITVKEKPKPVYYGFTFTGSMPEMNEHNNKLNSLKTDEEKATLRYAIINFARQFEGNPYVYGGTSLTHGTDCSGFTQSVYGNFGYRLPRTANSQGYMGMRISESELLPGDIIMYINGGVGTHVGIYIGNGMMIHAGTPQTGIVVAPMYAGYRVYSRIIY